MNIALVDVQSYEWFQIEMEAIFIETSQGSVDDDSFQIKEEPEEDPLTGILWKVENECKSPILKSSRFLLGR